MPARKPSNRLNGKRAKIKSQSQKPVRPLRKLPARISLANLDDFLIAEAQKGTSRDSLFGLIKAAYMREKGYSQEVAAQMANFKLGRHYDSHYRQPKE
ncbi:MAG: hypothetical protein AABW72_00935 [archaeon]